jgi:hypothetical protein
MAGDTRDYTSGRVAQWLDRRSPAVPPEDYMHSPTLPGRNYMSTVTQDRRGRHFCALSKLGEVKDGPAAHA